MLGHVGIEVGDFDRSRAFYEMALAPLGLEVVMEPMSQMAGFGAEGKPWFWVVDRGYAAFVRDPDGNNVEGVCHTPVD